MELFNRFNKIVLVVEYDGRRYYGFQWQTNLLTIQDELEKAIRKLTGGSTRVIGSCRTDTGVHARGQVVSFMTNSTLPEITFLSGLNYYLPGDIAVRWVSRVAMNFDVRRDAVSREYKYYILNKRTRSPLASGFAYLVVNKLDIELMNRACEFLKGEHDFASFASSWDKRKNTVRKIYEAAVTREDSLVTFKVAANSFLTHQVRNTVGLLIRVGLGKVKLEVFRSIVEAKTLGLAGPAVPAYGLCLMKVNYPSNVELNYEDLCN